MNYSSKEKAANFIQRIKSKLGEDSSDYPDYNATIYNSKSRLKDNDPVSDFNRNFTSVNGKVLFDIQELISFLLNHKLMFGFCESHLIEFFETKLNQKKIYLSSKFNRAKFEKYQFAITPALGAIAETGDDKMKINALLANIGTFNPETQQADDLKKISGVGPVMEQKLHQLGIYTFEQVSRMTDKDYDLLDSIIDEFPGRAKRDDWAGQAEQLKNS